MGNPGSWGVQPAFAGSVTQNDGFRLRRIVTRKEVGTVFKGRVTRNATFRLLRIVKFQDVESLFEGRVTRNESFRLLRIVTCQEVESVFEGRVTRNASFRLLPPLGFYNIKKAGRKSKAWFCLQYATSSNIVLGPWAQTGRQHRIPIRALPRKKSPD